MDRRLVWIGVVLALSACSAPPTPDAIVTPTDRPDTPVPPTATVWPDQVEGAAAPADVLIAETGRYVTILEVEGPVVMIDAPGGDPRPAGRGEALATHALLRTGADGRAVVQLDDGTLVVVGPNSDLWLTRLEGTADSPVTRLFLNLGQVFAIRERLPDLPPGAAFEVETPTTLATIRGSSMGVLALPSGAAITVCLSGSCASESLATGQSAGLSEGERVAVDEQGSLGAVEAATADDLQLGSEAIQAAEAARAQPEPDSRITLCHATGDSASPYVRLTVFYAAAEGHGHAGHADDLIPIPPQGCPGQDIPVPPTPTASPTITPTPNPLCVPTQPYTVGEEPQPPEGYQQLYLRRTEDGTHTLLAGVPIWLHSGGWVALGVECAVQNGEHVKHTITINGVEVPLTRSDIFSCSYNDLPDVYCFMFTALLDPLPVGDYTVILTVELDAQVTDGYDYDGDGEPDRYGPGVLRENTYTLFIREE